MQMVVDNPDLIERLMGNLKPVIGIDDHALGIREIYGSLVDNEKKLDKMRKSRALD